MESEKVKEDVGLRKPNLVLMQRWGETLRGREDSVAVRCPDGSDARTYAEIEGAAEAVAARLGEMSLAAGEVVSLRAGNVVDWPAMVLGIWKAGGAALLVDATLSEAQVAEAESAAGARVRVTWNGVVEARSLAGADAPWKPERETVLVKLTSGTTGVPRMIEFDAGAVVADCDQICETMGIGEEDVNYGVIAFAHSYGFSNLVTPLLFRGVPLVAAKDSLPRALWSGVAASAATVLPAVPAIFRALGGVARDALDGGRLRLCISAGAPLPPRVAREFREAHGLKIHSFYGASECGGICYDASEVDDRPDGFVGTPMRGVELRFDEDGSGTVRVRSAAICRGTEGELRPGDLLEGNDVVGYRIVGRTSEVVNVGGRKVNPTAVEAVIAGHPAVREVAVFGRGNAARVQSLTAVVVGGAEASELRCWCAERMANWQVPREIFVVAAIPLTPRGKVSRRELAEWIEGRTA